MQRVGTEHIVLEKKPDAAIAGFGFQLSCSFTPLHLGLLVSDVDRSYKITNYNPFPSSIGRVLIFNSSTSPFKIRNKNFFGFGSTIKKTRLPFFHK